MAKVRRHEQRMAIYLLDKQQAVLSGKMKEECTAINSNPQGHQLNTRNKEYK